MPRTGWRATEPELNFTFPPEHVTELIVLGKRMSPVAVDKLGFVGKYILGRECLSPANTQPDPATQVSVLWFIPSDYVPTPDTETFAIISTQPRKMQIEHWIMIENSRHNLFFCRLSRAKKVQFLQAAIRADEANSAFAVSTR